MANVLSRIKLCTYVNMFGTLDCLDYSSRFSTLSVFKHHVIMTMYIWLLDRKYSTVNIMSTEKKGKLHDN